MDCWLQPMRCAVLMVMKVQFTRGRDESKGTSGESQSGRQPDIQAAEPAAHQRLYTGECNCLY
jgi:hypothetical protein